MAFWATIGAVVYCLAYLPSKVLTQVLLVESNVLFWITIVIVIIGSAVMAYRYLFQSRFTLEAEYEEMAGYDKARMDSFASSRIFKGIEKAKSNQAGYKDIIFHGPKRPKTVYCITGGWKAGKTVATGYLVDRLGNNKDLRIGGVYYHDTFNFGNINESLATFFENISDMTGVGSFRRLGAASTPNIDMQISTGLVNFKWPMPAQFESISVVRKKIYDKLKKQGKTYVIVIDDLDRLKFEEQLLWLRAIELLGKFEGSIVVIAPVNYRELEYSLENNDINKRYAEKILPRMNHQSVGVDIDFIKVKFFNHTSEESIGRDLKRKYAKYLYSLVLRICIEELRNYDMDSAEKWYTNVKTGHMSKILTELHYNLSDDRYEKDGKTLWFNDGNRFAYHPITSLTSNCFLDRPSMSSYDMTKIKTKTLNYLANVSELEAMFSVVLFKEGEILKEEKYIKTDESWVNFWETLGYSSIIELPSDFAVAKYFTYNEIEREISILKKQKNEEEEAGVLSSLIMDFHEDV